MCQQLNNVRFVVTGDEINTDSAVIISNHKSLADFIAMAYLARFSNNVKPSGKETLQTFKHLTLPRINFFSWFRLWRVPSLRVLINLAKCDENWELEQSLNKVVFGSVMKTKVPEWIVLFPEVNIWTEEDSCLQKVQSEKFFLPKLQKVLYPRFSAFYNVISTLNKKKHSKFNKLYDVSILYDFGFENNQCLPSTISGPANTEAFVQSGIPFDISPNLIEIFSSATPITIYINVKSKTLQRIPTKRNKMEKWLEHTWVEKDKFLEQWESNLSKPSSKAADLICNTSKSNTQTHSPIKIGLSKIKL